MGTETIRDVTVGVLVYRIESISNLGYEIVQVVIVKNDAVIIFKKIKTL